MQFINPWLLAGLAGVAAPIAIHLMNRFRYRDVDWAAMDLLRKVLVVRSRRIRLEDLILLLLRCVIVALVALAIARPVLTPKGGTSRADVGAVIAIDASFSMAHQPGVYSRFDRAKERAQQILSTLKPGDPISIVLLGERPRVLVRNSGYEADRVSALLDAAEPLPERLNIDLCLAQLEELVGEIKAPAREAYLVSDAQTPTWGDLSEPSRATLERIAAQGRMFYLPVAGGRSENLAITAFRQQSGMVRQGALARYVAEVSNSGRQARQNVPVTLYDGDQVIDQRIIPEIGAGKTEPLALFVRFDQPGAISLSARIGDDELAVDNARFAVANVRPQVRVLCVEGTPPAGGSEDESYFLRSALAPRKTGDEAPPIAIDRVGWLDLSNRRLSDYDVVMLVDVPELREDQATAVGQFVSADGGLITFLGPNIVPGRLNESMRFEGGSLLPGTVRDALGDALDLSAGNALEPVKGHPLARGLAGLPKEVLDETRVRRFFPVELADGGRAVVKTGPGADDILMAEKPLGRGRVVLFTSTADRAWTDMVTHPSYPILLHETIAHLGRQGFERPLLVGAPLVVPLPLAASEAAPENVTCLAPGDDLLTVKTARRDGQVLADFGPAEHAGIYQIRHTATASIPVAVSVDPGESDARSLTASALDDALRGTNLKVVQEKDDLGAAIRQGRVGREIWRELLFAALLLLLLEAYLSRRFTSGFTRKSSERGGGLAGLKNVSGGGRA